MDIITELHKRSEADSMGFALSDCKWFLDTFADISKRNSISKPKAKNKKSKTKN